MIDTKKVLNNLTPNVITLKEFRSQLIHYKSSVAWIDKYGTKHNMFSNNPILDDEGEVDYKRATEIWRENEEKCYEWIIENKIDLLIKKQQNYGRYNNILPTE